MSKPKPGPGLNEEGAHRYFTDPHAGRVPQDWERVSRAGSFWYHEGTGELVPFDYEGADEEPSCYLLLECLMR